ncbi:hypothetical protein SUGI_0204040 [Cryptomeria japonica]|nr:hypothetical protein SUGI_0204040 [Cryptomeria japonica]
MSFLAGRLAGTEGAFFANQSKIAAARLREKLGDVNASPCPVPSSNDSSKADVLPEILRHSIPLSSGNDTASTMSRHSSLASVSAIVRGNTSSGEQLQLGRHQSPDVLNAMNPLNAWISVPRATFGPKRWTLPAEELSLQASTANEIRKDHSTSIDTEKMKAAMEGFSTIAKAFAIATGIIFGGTILAGIIAIKKLQLHAVSHTYMYPHFKDE